MMNISVIIPNNHPQHELLRVLHAVCIQTIKPCEIIIVDSANGAGQCPEEFKLLCSNIKLTYEYRDLALPGDARNIGLEIADGEFIAFIDVKTIPRPDWLETSLSLIESYGVSGMWGLTSFSAESSFEALVRDSFYGLLPIKTLPGSVFRREVIDKTGRFIEWVRAGEDTEWMLRVGVLRIPIVHSPVPLVDYVGLIGLDMKQILKKWYRNYNASRNLPHFFPQKLMIWLVLYPFLILVAFNWNYFIANWRMDSPMYIGHVTKIVAILPAFIYVFVRGLLLPIKRKVGISQLLPVRFLAITLVCFMADFIKAMVFSFPTKKNNQRTNNIDSLRQRMGKKHRE